MYIKENHLQDKIYFIIFEPDNYKPLDEDGRHTAWCGTSNNMYALDYKGDIYTCIRFMESSLNQEPIIIGNIEHGIGITAKEQKWLNKFKKCERCNIFDNECIAYFCKYYRERLNLNFEFYYNNDQVVTVLPILDCVKSRQVEEEKLLKNTNIILDKFVKENDTLKKILITPELYVKAYCEDCGNDNFFIYKDEYTYLI